MRSTASSAAIWAGVSLNEGLNATRIATEPPGISSISMVAVATAYDSTGSVADLSNASTILSTALSASAFLQWQCAMFLAVQAKCDRYAQSLHR